MTLQKNIENNETELEVLDNYLNTSNISHQAKKSKISSHKNSSSIIYDQNVKVTIFKIDRCKIIFYISTIYCLNQFLPTRRFLVHSSRKMIWAINFLRIIELSEI